MAFSITRAWIFAVATAFLVPHVPLLAQATFSEPFDNVGSVTAGQYGPSGLVSRGWIFRNQSSPSNAGNPWMPDTFQPQGGSGLLKINGGPWSNSSSVCSVWAVLPAIPNQIAGDVLRFYSSNASFPCCITNAHLEVRYSSSGGTSTGSGAAGVGDFSTLLADYPDHEVGLWTLRSSTLPGQGRIALRFFIPSQSISNFFFGDFAIDTLTLGNPPSLFPLPGQTVTWTAAMSPINIGNGTIPDGATVIVEPGVTININGGTLSVLGTLRGTGTPASHITVSSAAVFPPMIITEGGTVDLTFADIHGQIRPGPDGAYLLTDCTFSGNGMITSGNSTLALNLAFFRLTRCTFTGTGAGIVDAWAKVRDCTFTGGSLSFLRGYADVANTTSNGAPISITREGEMQPLLVGPVTVTNYAGGAGLNLATGDYAIAPGTILQSNAYAVDLHGGLLPESAVPTTGNTNNVIRAFNGGFAGVGHWSNFGIPYRLTEASTSLPGGHLTIAPGVTVEGQVTGAALLARSTRRIIIEGLPEAPITFRAVNPAQPWDGLAFITNATEGPRIEYADISGSRLGVVASDSNVYVDNCFFHDNLVGVNANTFGLIYLRNNDFTRNGAAVQVSAGLRAGFENNPNVIAGNSIGVSATGLTGGNLAEFNWWGSPTGPASPLNPGGTGDSVAGPGASGVAVLPFLTEAPPVNHAPVVRLVEPGLRWNTTERDPSSFYMPGDKAILRWSADDDDNIVSQRVLISGDGPYLDRFFVVADNLAGSAREYELTVPDVGFAVTNLTQFIRVIATDSLGQEGFDDFPCMISSGRITGNFSITNMNQYVRQTFVAGQPIPPVQFTGSSPQLPIIEVFAIYESDGGLFGNPLVSTDSLRLAIRARANANDTAWFIAPGYFSMRLDPRMGYTPPAVALTGPSQGATFGGGTTVPITWTASATEGIRSFDIFISTDAGNSFKLLVQDLPAAARSFDWRLPPSTGIADMRVRVVVRDRRFQNSCSRTAAGDLTISITPGQGCPADFNNDGNVDPDDLSDFITCFFLDVQVPGTCPASDFNADTFRDPDDLSDFITAFFTANC